MRTIVIEHRHCRAPVPDLIGDDPAIHPLSKKLLRRSMDARVEPAHDDPRDVIAGRLSPT
jgi:hypothetical protein